MWNRCIRRLLALPVTTHRKLLPLLNNTCSAIEQIYCRSVKLVQTMLKSHNVKVYYIAKRFSKYSNSVIGANLNVIAKASDCDVRNLLFMSIPRLTNVFKVNNEDSAPVAYQIMELKGAIDGDFNIDGFNQQELLDMYTFISCN